jgi:hypothetical protein
VYNIRVVDINHRRSTKKGGNSSVINSEKLKDAIQDSGLKMAFIAAQLGLSRGGLRNCITKKSEFRASQIQKLADLLKLDREKRDEIFFDRSGV